MYYYWDPTYILVIIGMLICLGASAMVNSAMSRYSRVRNAGGITGAEAARRILNNEGLYNVQIECLNHSGGDHYDPRTNTVRLSHDNYNQPSVTAVGVAAHECGHAIQHAKGYMPLNFRSALVPVANIGSRLGLPLILLGVILGWSQVLIEIGIWAFALAVLFQLVTLPVEFNASARAVAKIQQYGLLGTEETKGCKKVLTAAAMTYVAAAASAILQLLRLILLFGGNRRRDD
ncbi:zinc metallopeptidase [Acetatifactor muris]|uniref:Neutral zinc metallopeptidase n=1 Tax=Acetatifactor muris TaxID=879566 RepID=A0A2K4ZN49_9FIRM|nr:zinc metallopeptidase [Acetatifactor muris]MCI8799811.1 zinc metallopeptidase [Lachnospiraceae bacterium]MCR2050268.1 zinc metallopeptidase [Acetatifactor muris]SOY31898.1 Putative neutral zinc metallopeptidase [Acetatifactor muris]